MRKECKDIYKITNNFNKKVYIGQSNDPERRWSEHCRNDDSSYIGNAIQKYGERTFTFEILETQIEDYNERERIWINFFQSNNRDFGYNLTDGGESPPIHYGRKVIYQNILMSIFKNLSMIYNIVKKQIRN